MLVFLLATRPFLKKSDLLFHILHELILLAACAIMFILLVTTDDTKRQQFTQIFIYLFILTVLISIIQLFYTLATCCRKDENIVKPVSNKSSPEKVFKETNKTMID